MIPWFEFHTIVLGPIVIQVWGLCVALGMLLVFAILSREAKRRGLNRDAILSLTIKAIFWGFIGSRLVHVFLYEPAYYMGNPLEVLKIWKGGLSSFGGLLGAVASILWDSRRKKEFKVLALYTLTDVLAYSAIFGWIVGRVGCVLIHDHAGKPCSGCLLATPWRDGVVRLDMALLEIIGLIPLAIWFAYTNKYQEKFEGWYTAVLLLYYGILRFVLDFWRATDIVEGDTRYLGLTPGQYFAILLMLCGGSIYWQGVKKK